MVGVVCNTKAMIRSPLEDIDFFDIVAGVLWGDKIAPYLFIIRLGYVLPISIDLIKDEGFTLYKKAKSRQYPIETITDADHAVNLELLTNTPAQTESLLYSL